MKKRYIPSILIVLCLLIAACIDAAYAKYASVKKAENVFTLSSDVKSDVKSETYAAYSNSTHTLYFLNDILIEERDTIPGTENDTATEVYTNIRGDEFEPYAPWRDDDHVRNDIVTVRFLGDIAPINMNDWFNGCTSLTAIYGMAEHLHTSGLLYMNSAFAGCTQLTVLDLSGFDTENATDMEYMFEGCTNLKTIYATESFVIPPPAFAWGCELFDGCEALVGGNGTAFSSKRETDYTYARIDGKDGQPGYFTAPTHDHIIGGTWIGYGDETHSKYCSVYGEPVETEAHTYDENQKCTVCGYECKHSKIELLPNEDGTTHSKKCTACANIIETVAHDYKNDKCICGKEKTIEEPTT